ncbi:MAG TPA: DUF2577 family protein [Ruminiclostridium sp.]|nr:DUF2577 family protein [Ruminiclostridium sp.]
MKTNNPYTEMLSIMQEHGAKYNPPSIQLAEVLVPPPNLIIKMGDVQIDKNNILIADYLLAEYKRAYLADGRIVFSDDSLGGETAKNSCQHPHPHSMKSIEVDTYDYHTAGGGREGSGEDKDKYLRFKDTLFKGDVLAVMPTYDMQMYIVLARVVRPDAFV